MTLNHGLDGKNFISPFVFNPFLPPRNVKLETYKSTLKTAFAAAVTMASPLDKIFEEAQDLIHAFMKTEAYDDFLIRCIRSAVRFAGTDPVTVYINLSDEKKKTALEDATQVHLSVSAEDFIGGVRSVIRSRNILIDNSFQTQLKDQYDKFIFEGGDGIG